MEKYNLSQIMKDAHRVYNSEFQRKGRSWAECLQAAWRWEKDAVKVRSEKDAKQKAVLAASWAQFEANKNRPNPYNDVTIPSSAFYNPNSIGLFGAHYVGD